MTKHRYMTWSLLPTAAAALTALATAQSTNPPSQAPSHQPAKNPGSDEAKAVQKGSKTRATLVPGEAAEKKDVVNTTGGKIGDIEDFLIGARSGRVEFVVMEVVGADWVNPRVAVPYGAFEWNEQQEIPSLNMTTEQLERAPKYDEGKWKGLLEDSQRQPLFQFYGVDEAPWRQHIDGYDVRDNTRNQTGTTGTITPRRGSMENPSGGDAIKSDREGQENLTTDSLAERDMPGRTQLVRWTEIDDHNLETLVTQEKLGTVDDIVFDCRSGRIGLAVVSFGGFLGMGDTKVTLPWDHIRVKQDGELCAVNVEVEKLKGAPKYEYKNWEAYRDGTYYQQSYQHYGTDASWINGETSTGAGSGRVSTPESGGAMKQFNAKGTITDVNATSVSAMPNETVVNFRTEDGKTVAVLLGPQARLNSEGVVLTKDSTCTINGYWVTRDGKQFVHATSITTNSGKVVPLHTS